MKTKFFLFIILGMFLISLVSATNIGTFQVNKPMQIVNYCSTGDCTYANLTSISLPDGTVQNINSAMTQNGQNFNYSYTPSQTGTYGFNTCSNPLGVIVCDSDTFEVTPNGKEFSTGNAIAYLGFLLLTLITLFLTLLGASKVKWKHKKDKEGKIISINDFRYVKVFLFSMSYMIAMFLFGLSYKLFNEVGMEGFNDFFNFLYQLFLRLMYPVIIVTVLSFVAIFLSNLKLKRNKELGL